MQKYSVNNTIEGLLQNLKMNCIPLGITNMTLDDYPEFLNLRHKLMAEKMREYYFKL